ncbi:hypothetical protein WKY82_09320 [Gordonia malaquae]|uniref:hypothetical protein n=1 Tax=Gordonia malaquae TaxID=410332 RepID=UPI003015950C
MSSEVVIAVIAAVGSSGVVSAVVMALLNRKRNSVEVTQIVSQMSKDALLDAKGSIDDLRSDIRELRAIIEDFVRVVECDVLPAIPVEQTEPRRHLRAIASRAKAVV